jgi:hypothetical protein
MGLDVCVGVLASGPDGDPDGFEWLLRDFAHVNRVLAANGLPPHEEPQRLPDLPYRYRGQLLSFPYSWLHYLRRAVAYARQAPDQFRPVADGDNPADDKRTHQELDFLESHLICHSDCEGFYVPIDFPEPLYDDQKEGLPGGILGSSQRALRETMQAAPLLAIPLRAEQLSDEAAKGIVEEPDGSHPYWVERKVWLTMYEAFRHSVEYKCAVVFG